MRGIDRAITRAIGVGVMLLVCAGGAFGQMTRAGAVGTINPVPTAGAATQFHGHSTSRTFPNCRGGNFKYGSRGFAGGGIGYRSCVSVPAWSYTNCSTGIYPWYYYPYTYGGWQSTYAGGPLYEVNRLVGAGDPTVVVILEPKVDEALDALQAGRFASARLMYLERAHERSEAEADGEETGVDRTALRLAGLAAAGERRYPEADRLFTEAYSEDPSLVDRPLDGATLVRGARDIRDIVNGAVAYAYKVGTADAWKMVAWLMQGEGRNDQARAMMARADEIAARVDTTEDVVDAGKFAATTER